MAPIVWAHSLSVSTGVRGLIDTGSPVTLNLHTINVSAKNFKVV
jgi:hypothetical protein